MITNADFVLIWDNPTDPQSLMVIGGDIDKETTFNIPAQARLNEVSVLTFRIHTQPDAQSLRLKVYVNTIEQLHYDVPLTGRHLFTIHEFINASVLKAGANTIKFELLGSAGSMKVSDVYVLFRETN